MLFRYIYISYQTELLIQISHFILRNYTSQVTEQHFILSGASKFGTHTYIQMVPPLPLAYKLRARQSNKKVRTEPQRKTNNSSAQLGMKQPHEYKNLACKRLAEKQV